MWCLGLVLYWSGFHAEVKERSAFFLRGPWIPTQGLCLIATSVFGEALYSEQLRKNLSELDSLLLDTMLLRPDRSEETLLKTGWR